MIVFHSTATAIGKTNASRINKPVRRLGAEVQDGMEANLQVVKVDICVDSIISQREEINKASSSPNIDKQAPRYIIHEMWQQPSI